MSVTSPCILGPSYNIESTCSYTINTPDDDHMIVEDAIITNRNLHIHSLNLET